MRRRGSATKGWAGGSARSQEMAGGLAQEPVVGGDGVAEPNLDSSEVDGQRRESHLVEEVAGQGCLTSAEVGGPVAALQHVAAG